MEMTPQAWPDWYDGRHINEVLFCQQFLDKHPMKCVRGRLFTVDGLIEDEGQIGKGAQSQNAQAHSGGGNSGKGAARSADDGAVCAGGLPDAEAAAA